jgi:hypothetical protein
MRSLIYNELCVSYRHIHTHTHAYTHVHTHTHICIYTRSHTRSHLYIHIRTRTRSRKYIYTHTDNVNHHEQHSVFTALEHENLVKPIRLFNTKQTLKVVWA